MKSLIKIIGLIVCFGMIFGMLIACSKKNTSEFRERTAIEYLRNRYGIESEVISEQVDSNRGAPEGKREYSVFQMKEKDKNIYFECKVYYRSNEFGIADLIVEENYGVAKLLSNQKEVEDIENKYNVEIKYPYKESNRAYINVNVENGEEIDYDMIKSALVELMESFEDKTESNATIYLYVNGKQTNSYYQLDFDGKKAVRLEGLNINDY